MAGKPPSEVLYDSATALRQVDSILAELGADDSESPTPSLSRHDDSPVFQALRQCRELLATLRASATRHASDATQIAILDELEARFAALSQAAAEHAAHCPAGLDGATSTSAHGRSAAP
jgi:hypothetical protein